MRLFLSIVAILFSVASAADDYSNDALLAAFDGLSVDVSRVSCPQTDWLLPMVITKLGVYDTTRANVRLLMAHVDSFRPKKKAQILADAAEFTKKDTRLNQLNEDLEIMITAVCKKSGAHFEPIKREELDLSLPTAPDLPKFRAQHDRASSQ